MKKLVPALALVVLAVMLFPTQVFAHGHGHGGGGGGRNGTASERTLCSVEDCHISYTHLHGDTYYWGHSLNDGHDYHSLCEVDGCIRTTVHEHDDVTCFPHYYGDGHDYHGTCTVEGCTRTCLHEHDGVTCFPHNGTGSYPGGRHGGRGRHH